MLPCDEVGQLRKGFRLLPLPSAVCWQPSSGDLAPTLRLLQEPAVAGAALRAPEVEALDVINKYY